MVRINDLTRSNLISLQAEVERYREWNKRQCVEAATTSWAPASGMAPTRLYLPTTSYPVPAPSFPHAAGGGLVVPQQLQPPSSSAAVAWMQPIGRAVIPQPWQHGGYL